MINEDDDDDDHDGNDIFAITLNVVMPTSSVVG